jgi:hypothetical protein
MIKMTQHKWLVLAVSLCLGERSSFGADNWLQKLVNNLPAVKEARQNCDAYSQKINFSSDRVNQLCDQIDKNRDDSAIANNGDLTHEQAVAIRQQSLAAYWNTQKNINTLVPIAQQYRDATVQYAASHPGDKKAQADAQEALNAYTKLVKMGNNNGDRISHATDNLRGQDPGTNYPDAPNKIEPAKVPSATDTGGNTSNQPKDDTQVPSTDSLQNDLNSSYTTEKNIDKLLPLAQQYRDITAKNAQMNPDDPVAQANAENAQHDLDKLDAWQKRNGNRITSDLVQKYPPEEKKSGDDAQDHSTGPSGSGEDIINDLLGPFSLGGVVMASDQGDASTQKFIDSISGNNGAGGDTSNQSKDNARDHAKDAARDAASSARDAASAARDSARPATDGMRNCPDGH